jgi:hypothetical protein
MQFLKALLGNWEMKVLETQRTGSGMWQTKKMGTVISMDGETV